MNPALHPEGGVFVYSGQCRQRSAPSPAAGKITKLGKIVGPCLKIGVSRFRELEPARLKFSFGRTGFDVVAEGARAYGD
jgi:hypothetical protein